MFWKNKLLQNTLEQLVKSFKDFKEELKSSREDQQKKHQELLDKIEKREEKKISIFYYPDNELFVEIGDDKVVSKDTSRERFDKLVELRKNKDVEGIKNLLLGEKPTQQEINFMEEEDNKIENLVDELSVLVSTGDFEVKGDSLYATGLDRSIPKALADKFLETYMNDNKDEYNALKNFWYWCCLNPIAPVADSLFDYLNRHYLKLNKNGFFYALRNVDKVRGSVDHEFVEFISQSYAKVKAVWKKSPSSVYIMKHEGEYRLVEVKHAEKDTYLDWSVLGTVKELYDKLPEMEENRYTDNYTKTMDIRVGKKVRMNPEDCHWQTVNCGDGGLHWTLELDSYQCGDAEMLILINPATVVGLGSSKGRCYEYLPLCAIERGSALELLKSGEFDTTAIEDADYAEEMENLEEKVRRSFTAEAKRYELITRPYTPTTVTQKQVEETVQKLIDVSQRVQQIQ
jgi:hypothetical protein